MAAVCELYDERMNRKPYGFISGQQKRQTADHGQRYGWDFWPKVMIDHQRTC
jgi:hypothetical protein